MGVSDDATCAHLLRDVAAQDVAPWLEAPVEILQGWGCPRLEFLPFVSRGEGVGLCFRAVVGRLKPADSNRSVHASTSQGMGHPRPFFGGRRRGGGRKSTNSTSVSMHVPICRLQWGGPAWINFLGGTSCGLTA